MYTLGTAAKATGLAKSTIHRAIKAGKISARSKDGAGYEIDPAELHRVFPPVSQEVASTTSENSCVERSAIPEGNGSNARSYEIELALAKTEAQLAAIKDVLALERQRADELRQDRDAWKGQAERLAIAPPVPITPAQTVPAWWPWKRSA